MGAIQGAINSALGTVASAAAVGKHFKESAAKEKVELTAKGTQLYQEYEEGQAELKKQEAVAEHLKTHNFDPRDPKNYDYDEATGTVSSTDEIFDESSHAYYQKYMEKSLRTLQENQNAKAMQLKLYSDRLQKLNRGGF